MTITPYTNLNDWLGIIKYENDPSAYFEYQCSHKARIRSKNKKYNKKSPRKNSKK